jgi:molybdenum cofactor cytidylyltransferase
MNNNAYAGIILAAGASSRMGRPKQLLHIDGLTLLERIIRTACEAKLSPLISVLGAHADKVEPLVRPLPTDHVYNENWQTGMGSSIATGLKKALALNPEIKGALFLLVDQPFVSPNLLMNMKTQADEGDNQGVVCQYDNTLGVPALFKKALFDDLLRLDAERGAKPLINQYQRHLAVVPFPKGKIDLDFPREWAQFIKKL